MTQQHESDTQLIAAARLAAEEAVLRYHTFGGDGDAVAAIQADRQYRQLVLDLRGVECKACKGCGCIEVPSHVRPTCHTPNEQQVVRCQACSGNGRVVK
jgi:hypothetical protein